MKLINAMNAGDVAEYGNGVSNLGEFKIRASAKAFNILSSGLYANKIRAIVREIGCNAVDSHAAAGRPDVPFDVHLPSMLEPYFYIRDYGTGLSHDDVTKIYTTYFESTKTDSNDYIGALGLGSKSPFSYTDNFTVTAIKNGRKGIYSAFISDTGFPSIMLMSEHETDEPSGVEVRFSVNKQTDFIPFKNEAADVYAWFKTKPNILNCESFKFQEIEYAMRDVIPSVHVLSKYSPASGTFAPTKLSYAVMGNICYPIDSSFFEDHQNTLKHGLVIEFAIGELDFQASREGLSYIPATIEAIKTKLDAVTAAMQKVFDADVANLDTTDLIAVWNHVLKYANNSLMARIVDDYCKKFTETIDNYHGRKYDKLPVMKYAPYKWGTNHWSDRHALEMYFFDVELQKFNIKIGAAFETQEEGSTVRLSGNYAKRSYKVKSDKPGVEYTEHAYVSVMLGERSEFSTMSSNLRSSLGNLNALHALLEMRVRPFEKIMQFIVHEAETQIPINRIRNHVKQLHSQNPDATPRSVFVFEAVDKSKPTDIQGFLKYAKIPTNMVVWKTHALLKAPSKPRKKRSIDVNSLMRDRMHSDSNAYRFYSDSRVPLDSVTANKKLYVRLDGSAIDFKECHAFTDVIRDFATAFSLDLETLEQNKTLGIYGFNKTAFKKIKDNPEWVCLRQEIVNRILSVGKNDEEEFEKYLVQSIQGYSCLLDILAYNRSATCKTKLNKNSPILAFKKYVDNNAGTGVIRGPRISPYIGDRIQALVSLEEEFAKEIGGRETCMTRINKRKEELKRIFSNYAVLKHVSFGNYMSKEAMADIEHIIKYINTVDKEV